MRSIIVSLPVFDPIGCSGVMNVTSAEKHEEKYDSSMPQSALLFFSGVSETSRG